MQSRNFEFHPNTQLLIYVHKTNRSLVLSALLVINVLQQDFVELKSYGDIGIEFVLTWNHLVKTLVKEIKIMSRCWIHNRSRRINLTWLDRINDSISTCLATSNPFVYSYLLADENAILKRKKNITKVCIACLLPFSFLE